MQPIRSILLLTGAFTFAFLLGEMVHELGHYLGHMAYGNPANVRIQLDPFGGSRITGVTPLANEVLGVTAAIGPLLNLLLGLAFLLMLWPKRRPILFPFLLWGAVAAIQEGVTFTLGLLVPTGDADLMVIWGIPGVLILLVGILLLLVGTTVITLLLPLVGISAEDSFWRKLSIVLVGMGSFMLLRFVHSLVVSTATILENLVPLIFSILLATIVAWLHKPLTRLSSREFSIETSPVSGHVVTSAVALGAIVLFVQIMI